MDEAFSIRAVKFGQIQPNVVTNCDPIVSEDHSVSEMGTTKTQRGRVRVDSFRGRLRLIWSFAGRRYFFSLELPDTKANRAIAELKAKQIERDIANDLFDPTLEKYRAVYQRRVDGLSATEVFEKYIAYKAKTLRKRSLEKYTFTLSHLRQFFKDVSENVSNLKTGWQTEWSLSR